jgi:hypothetical protein
MRYRNGIGVSNGAFGLRFNLVLPRSGQQPAAQVELCGAMAVGEEAVMANAVEAVGQRM